MNVYDFDGTLYDGDSSIDFYKYCLKKHPQIIKYLPIQILYFFKYMFKKVNKTQMKEKFFSYFECIDTMKEIEEFWTTHKNKIFAYYKNKREESDIVISASPEILLRPICDELKIKKLIASKVDEKTGKFYGLNCWGEEKVRRLKKEYNIDNIDEFYSDSYSDTPLASIAKKAFLIKRGNIYKWS